MYHMYTLERAPVTQSTVTTPVPRGDTRTKSVAHHLPLTNDERPSSCVFGYNERECAQRTTAHHHHIHIYTTSQTMRSDRITRQSKADVATDVVPRVASCSVSGTRAQRPGQDLFMEKGTLDVKGARIT